MASERFLPAAPLGPDGPYLIAILGVLDDIHDLLQDRLPTTGGEPVPVKEPMPEKSAPKAVPLKEPAPPGPPDPSDDEDEQPLTVTEPARPTAPLPAPPPRAGRGASADAWRTWATAAGITPDDDATRDDIIAACAQAGLIEAR